MIPELIKEFLQALHKRDIHHFALVGGGSINDAFRYSVGNEEFFVKYNNQVQGIINREVDGLNAIANLNCIKTPEIIAYEKLDDYEVLVLRFINSGLRTPKAWESFGQQLAEMHLKPATYYGWYQDNFIGSLHQTNKKYEDFIDFFISERLRPQIKLAKANDYFSAEEIKKFDCLFQKLEDILPETQPSLVHGDLWSGNFMIGEEDTPFLIDPSIHYNFRETDIAFTHLFGGFDRQFYDAYNSYYPLAKGFQDRIALYNIYPLLVHLNLFGTGYYGSLMSNLNQYV
ncbi:Fructosamine-3-kinase [Marivirga sericea]|uniref:Fructosamine-3-kinase n=1 Tax=Marivirga sericea TaxID=1028 RepID=A0A1X7KF25_9BACT|nr:fructosamine kinase family protein [Marivirga sericea]SMG39045.1 Fructosamine-3-kinase [Marivirga sericea]